MNGRNDERETEDDGFYTVIFDERAYDASKEHIGPVPDCLRCHDTGYVRDWRGTQVKCEDCWQDNGE